ncbi:MAG TPA: hypothetical protein VMB85_16705 [Bryobacteraceae bacterium]|nr:hypothetical protein [Bryobacteraceae bacterium]
MTGKVTKWTGEYGFIGCGFGVSFFFRPDALRGPIRYGDTVEFWIDDDPRKPGALMAVDIMLKEGAAEELSRLGGGVNLLYG